MKRRKRKKYLTVRNCECLDWPNVHGYDGEVTIHFVTSRRRVTVELNEYRLVELLARLRPIALRSAGQHERDAKRLLEACDAS